MEELFGSGGVSRSDGGWKILCIKVSYSKQSETESLKWSSTIAESSQVLLGDVKLNSDWLPTPFWYCADSDCNLLR